MVAYGSWMALTTLGNEAYHPLWAPTLLTEIAINGGLVLAWLFIAFLFFSKVKAFPKWYIATLIFTLIFILVDALAIKSILPEQPLFDFDTARDFVRSLIVALVWAPDMLVSKRVKATFVS